MVKRGERTHGPVEREKGMEEGQNRGDGVNGINILWNRQDR